jgi:hypothetical protein
MIAYPNSGYVIMTLRLAAGQREGKIKRKWEEGRDNNDLYDNNEARTPRCSEVQHPSLSPVGSIGDAAGR